MKTLIFNSLSCFLLAAMYIMLNNGSQVTRLLSFQEPDSVSLIAEPNRQQERTGIDLNMGVETLLSPIETLPIENNTIGVVDTGFNSIAMPVQNINLNEQPSNTLIDSNWIYEPYSPRETTPEVMVPVDVI